MTDTELRQRLTTSVAGYEAPPDLLDRVRAGGVRRVRRRRFAATATAVTLTAGLTTGILTTVDRQLTGSDQVGPAATTSATPTAAPTAPATTASRVTPDKSDPYAVLLPGPTRGDLARDESYLAEVVAIWNQGHDKSDDKKRGIFRFLRGKPKVAWAGNTPSGPAAIVVQQADLRQHENLQLRFKGVYTLIGFVGTGAGGRQTLIADDYPAPGSGLAAAFLTGAQRRTLVAPDLGYPLGWSDRRTYSPNGWSRHDFRPVQYRDGVAVVTLPADVDPGWLLLSRLPVPRPPEVPADLPAVDSPRVAGLPAPTRSAPYAPFTEEEEARWPLTPGAKVPDLDLFWRAVDAANAPITENTHYLPWHAYGITADGSSLTLGEMSIGGEPSRIYAVLRNSSGEVTRMVSGEVPDFRTSALPLVMHLPDGHGSVVARPGAKLSYHVDGWPRVEPRTDAILVPEGPEARVTTTVNGQDRTVALN